MLKKILKYDLASVSRIFWIVAVSVLGLSVVGSVALRFVLEMAGVEGMALLCALGYLVVMLCMVGVVASIAVTEILVFLRFYKNFYTDEGYLTFTLPVSRRTLLLSKTLNAFFWIFAHYLLLFVCVGIFCLVAPPVGEGDVFFNLVIFEGLGELLSQAWKAIGAWLIVYILEGILFLFVLTGFSVSLVHFCITVGAMVAKKAKLLAGIGIYYLANMILSGVFQILGTFGLYFLIDGLIVLLEGATLHQGCATIALILMIALAMIAVFANILYCMTLNRLERKLNLA